MAFLLKNSFALPFLNRCLAASRGKHTCMIKRAGQRIWGTEMFADKLKKLRKNKHLTQGELASFLGISASAVGMYEQSRRSPSISDISAIAKFFGVTTDYLLDSQSDEREVGELINELKNRLLCADGLMFNGEALTESELKQLSDAIEISAAVVLSQKERKNDEQNQGSGRGNL